MSIVRKAGTADVSVVIRIVDSADGTPETGVVAATAGLALEYRRELEASVGIAESDLAALTTAHTDGGMKHIGNGYYRVDLPDAACAAGAAGVLVHGAVTGMVVVGEYVQLVSYDPFDTVRLGLTALPNAAAEAAGGLYTRGSGAGQIAQQQNGQIDANVERVRNAAINVLISGRVDANAQVVGDKTGYALTAAEEDAITDKVWDELKSAHTTPDSFGDYLDDEITSRSSHSAADVWAVGTRTLTGLGFVLAAADLAAGIITAAKFAAGAIDAAAVATDAIGAAEVSAGAANKIADHVLRRALATAEASADGDALAFRSLLGAVAKLVNKIALAAGTLTVYKADDTTALGTQAATQDASANPVTALDTV